MKEKKGFTIIELLVTIVILGLLFTIGLVSYRSISLSVRQRQYENVIKRIEAASLKYASETNAKVFTVKMVIEKGLLLADGNSNTIYSPVDKTDLGCYIINMIDGQAVFNRNSTGDCSDLNEIDNLDFQLRYVVSGSCSGNPRVWTNTNKVLCITSNTKDVSGIEEVYWSTPLAPDKMISGKTYEVKVAENSYVIEVYKARVKYNDGKNYLAKAEVRIDKVKPTCIFSGESTVWTNNNREITLGCEDELSGCKTEGNSFTKTYTTTIKTDTFPSYEVSDNAGNKTNCEGKEVDVYVDKTKPTTAVNIKTHDTFVMTSSDSDSGLDGYAVVKGTLTPTSWKTSSNLGEIEHQITSSGNYYAWIKDRAGNTNKTLLNAYDVTVNYEPNVVVSNIYGSTLENTSFVAFEGPLDISAEAGAGYTDVKLIINNVTQETPTASLNLLAPITVNTSSTECPIGTYFLSGTAKECETCPTGYTSEVKAKEIGECYLPVSGGRRLPVAMTTDTTRCAAGTYKRAHNVYYGNTSSCNKCPSGSYCPAGSSSPTSCPSGYTSASGASSRGDCYINVSAGRYKTSSTGSSTARCAGGYYKSAHKSYYGDSDSCSKCPGDYWCSAGSSSINDCYVQIGAGRYKSTATGWSSNLCAVGTYSNFHVSYYGKTDKCIRCVSGTYSCAGASTCPKCSSKYSNCATCTCYRCLTCNSGYTLVNGRCVKS